MYNSLEMHEIPLSEYGSFLKWSVEECKKHNPRDIFDYYYKTASKTYFVSKYKISRYIHSEPQKNNVIPKTICPVCNTEVSVADSDCQ